jgi:FKBP-type peptidyl-prolyl cis-trans isomerase
MAQTCAVRFHIASTYSRMKLQSLLTAGFLALGVSAAALAQEIKLNLPGKTDAAAPAAPAAAPATPAAPAFTNPQLVEEFGWFMARRLNIPELQLSKDEIEAFARGIAIAAAGKDAPYELAKAGPLMDELMKKKQEIYMGKLKQQGLTETAAFLADIKKKAGVVTTPSGLCYEILKPGDGSAPKPTDTVKVHYTGTLISGAVFDSSVQRGEPIDIPLDQVIAGWTEGLQKISKGGKIKLYVPPHLAYGDDGKGGIPPASTLIFEVELLDFKPTPPPAQAPAPAGK